jgi:tetratricopeptide (TPR) repeat protein
LITGVVVLTAAGLLFADYWSASPPEARAEATFVGRQACVNCHRDESEAFRGSHHDLAMDLATDETVRGDFNDLTFQHDGITSRFFRDGDRFMVNTEGPTGKLEDFQVKYVFGWEPLQQYMVEFDRPANLPEDQLARLQVLRLSWDTEQQEWFYLRPPDVDEKLDPDDPLHWTGIAQRWQTMCAECHSTNLKRNFDPQSGRYHTTFSEIDVSCESCHGPGSLHVELANSRSLFWDRHHGYGLARLKGDDAEPQLQTCAPCHSRRGVMNANFRPGDKFTDHYALESLNPDTYHVDGQIKDEVYVYGSFIQSKMYHKGIRCTDCHDPHSLKLKHSGNETCTSCHQHAAGKYDVPSHHHHNPGTAGAMCVDCHMPHTTYMAVDERRDHSLRVPRPDLSVQLGTPNACSSCHVRDQLKSLPADKQASLETAEYAEWLQMADDDQAIAETIKTTDNWCDQACETWYGAERKQPPHFAQAIAAFRNGDDDAVKEMLRLMTKPDEEAPAIAKATAIGELANAGIREALPIAKQWLANTAADPIVRAASVNVFMSASPSATIRALMPRLADKSRLVRNEAARVLIASGAYQQLNDSERSRVDLALKEVKQSLMVASDRAGAHMGWAMLCEQRGRAAEAIAAYETAIKVEPLTTGARTNLASLLERVASQSRGPDGPLMMQRAAELRRAELPLLGRDAALAPDNADVQYRYGLALYLSGDQQAALKQLERAVELAPEVETFQTALDLLREKINE